MNLPVQSLNKARTLKLRIYEEGELYYQCSEKKKAPFFLHNSGFLMTQLICSRLCSKHRLYVHIMH